MERREEWKGIRKKEWNERVETQEQRRKKRKREGAEREGKKGKPSSRGRSSEVTAHHVITFPIFFLTKQRHFFYVFINKRGCVVAKENTLTHTHTHTQGSLVL